MWKFFSRPTPLWFSLVRFAGVLGVIYFLGRDPMWKPVADEAVTSMSEVRKKAAQAVPDTEGSVNVEKAKANKPDHKEPIHGNDPRTRN